MKEKVVFVWSSGKDCARALHEIRQNDQYDVVSLLTTVTEGYERISMHGVRIAIVEQQAESIGLLLEKVYIPKGTSNENYETAMRDALLRYKAKGVIGVVFGDLFLEDLKQYREKKLAEVGMTIGRLRNVLNIGRKPAPFLKKENLSFIIFPHSI